MNQITLFDFEHRNDDKYVREISYEDAKPFLLNIHYARRIPCIVKAYGLFVGGGANRMRNIRDTGKLPALHRDSRKRKPI